MRWVATGSGGGLEHGSSIDLHFEKVTESCVEKDHRKEGPKESTSEARAVNWVYRWAGLGKDRCPILLFVLLLNTYLFSCLRP